MTDRAPQRVCVWVYDEHCDMWDTTCDNAWQFTVDGPKENKVKWCPFCGGKLKLAPAGGGEAA